MFLDIILLIMGFIILIKGADIFVDGASSVASNFKLSKMLIGLTIVAFGTSAPEFAVSIKSILSSNSDMLIGNVIGSNILNILLILGLSGCIYPMTIKSRTVRKELPITLMITTLLIVLIGDSFLNGGVNLITRSDGIVLLLFFLVFVYYLISIMRNKIDNEREEAKYKLVPSILFTVGGIVAIVFGSSIVVDHASAIATYLGVSERMIALTIVAFGTSLPELVTSIIAAKKKENDIAIGNIIGSNIFNIGIVLGLPVAMFGTVNASGFQVWDLLFFFLSALVLFLFSYKNHKLSKLEGIVMLLLFIIYYSVVIIGGIL